MSNSDKISERDYEILAKEVGMILDNIQGLVFYKDTENNIIRVINFLSFAY